jgi:hypothetical protein
LNIIFMEMLRKMEFDFNKIVPAMSPSTGSCPASLRTPKVMYAYRSPLA